MKRIISLCCVALILVSSMAVPVMASEINNDNVMMELLDYNSVTSSGNFFAFTGSYAFPMYLPYTSNLYYCDILFTAVSGTGMPITSVLAEWQGNTLPLTVKQVSGNLYRAYGPVPAGNYTLLGVHLIGDASTTYYVTLHSCKVMPVQMTHFESEGFCHIVSTLSDKLIHYVPSDEINYRYIDATGQASYDCEFTLNLYVSDWQKYDYLDFSLLLSCESITSVTASCGDTLLDFEVSEFENSNLPLKDYRIYSRLDLTGLDRTLTDIPTVIITGQWSPNLINLVQVLGISGFVDFNVTNPIIYYFQKLLNVFTTGFSNVNTWIINHALSINAAIDEQTRRLELAFQGDPSGADTSAGQKFQEDVAAKDQELDDMSSVMDSVQKPNIDQIDVSVDRFVSQADVQVLASPMAVFFEGEIFSKIIIMSILLATVSYVLYGKR